eukprot:1136620-Pelagomonas_calceolata.AAC.2
MLHFHTYPTCTRETLKSEGTLDYQFLFPGTPFSSKKERGFSLQQQRRCSAAVLNMNKRLAVRSGGALHERFNNC